jgi:glutamate racemase
MDSRAYRRTKQQIEAMATPNLVEMVEMLEPGDRVQRETLTIALRELRIRKVDTAKLHIGEGE